MLRTIKNVIRDNPMIIFSLALVLTVAYALAKLSEFAA